MEHSVSFSADTGVYAFGSGDLAKKQMAVKATDFSSPAFTRQSIFGSTCQLASSKIVR